MEIFPAYAKDDSEYLYYNKDEWNIANCKGYLKALYTDEEYNAEVARLSGIEGILYDEDNYP